MALVLKQPLSEEDNTLDHCGTRVVSWTRAEGQPNTQRVQRHSHKILKRLSQTLHSHFTHLMLPQRQMDVIVMSFLKEINKAKEKRMEHLLRRQDVHNIASPFPCRYKDDTKFYLLVLGHVLYCQR